MRTGILLALSVVASTALADWQTLTLPGIPQHVSVKGPDHFAVTTDQGVYELVDGGVARPLTFAGLVAGFVDGSGCLGGGTSSGILTALDGGAGTCAYGYSLFQSAPGVSLGGLSYTSAGTAYATGVSGVAPELRYNGIAGTPTQAQWVKFLPGTLTPAGKVSALRVGATDYALFSGTLTGVPGMLLATGSSAVAQYRLDAGVSEVQLFEPVAGGVQALVAPPTGGLQVVSLDAGINPPVAWATLPGPAALRTVAFGLTPGTGEVFGMAVQGTGTLIGAVPETDPTRLGRSWVALTQSPPGMSSLAQVRCSGARTCLAISDSATAPNVAIFRNLATPSTPASSSLTVDEGQSLSASVTTTDPDGDAVLTRWDTSSNPPFTLTPQADGKSALIAADRGRLAYCGPAQVAYPIPVTATDGLPAHSSDAGTVTVTVRHVIPPDPPGVSPTDLSAPAGGPPASATATPGAAGCTPTSYSAMVEAGGVAGVTVQASNPFNISLPVTHCSLDGGTTRIRIHALDSAGASDAGVVTVHVVPWGTPDAPFADGGGFTQLAGTQASYPRQATHTCALAPGFPGVVTTWWLDAGLPAGLDVTVNGVSLTAGPGQATAAQVVSTDSCTGGVVRFAADNATGGARSAASVVTVTVQPNPRPLEDAGFTVDAGFEPGGSITGVTDVPGLDCVASRDLGVDLAVERGGNALATLGGQPLGAFALPGVPLDCSGDTVDVVARLTADGGSTSRTARVTVQTPVQAAGVGELTGGPLVAACNAGATGVVGVSPGPLQCASAAFDLTPTSDAGVEVRVQRLDGGSFSVSTVATGLSDLLGHRAVFLASADGGPGNFAMREVSLGFTAEPFVQLRHLPQLPQVRTPEALTVTVELTNLSACEVEQVTLRERVSGQRWVEGSARLDGRAVEARESSGVLETSGIALPAGAVVRFSYSTRVTPFAAPVWEGAAFIDGIQISHPEPAVAGVSGCGCGTAGASPFAMFVLALPLILDGLRRRKIKIG